MATKVDEQVKELSAALMRDIGKSVEQFLATGWERYGLTVHYVGGRYDDRQGTLKIEVKVNGAQPDPLDEFKIGAWAIGIDPESYGRTFLFASHLYKIVGVKPRSVKYPIIAEQVATGKRFKFPKRVVSEGGTP